MKKQLTQEDVDNYMKSNFAKSRMYRNKVINLEHGVYNLVFQAATIATFNLRKDFDFGAEEVQLMLKKSFQKLKYPSGSLLNWLKLKTFPYWGFFEWAICKNEEHIVSYVHAQFKEAFPFEETSLKNFYKKLKHWCVENNYNLNVKGFFNNKTLIVTK